MPLQDDSDVGIITRESSYYNHAPQGKVNTLLKMMEICKFTAEEQKLEEKTNRNFKIEKISEIKSSLDGLNRIEKAKKSMN